MPPANDDLANRTVLGADSGTLTGQTNVGATLEGSEAEEWSNDQSVWYEFTPSEDGDLCLTVSGAGLDNATKILGYALYTGSGTYPLTRIRLSRFDDDSDLWVNDGDSVRANNLVGGTTYYLKIYSPNFGTADQYTVAFDLDWLLIPPDPTPPSYDDIQDAYTLSPSGGTVTVTTIGATLEGNEFSGIGYGNFSPPVWLRIDLSAAIGTGDGTLIGLTAEGISGDGCDGNVHPYLQVMFDPTGTFDPTSPDFSLLTFSDSYYGDGSEAPGAASLVLNPDALDNGDTNPTGIYWIYVNDWFDKVKGEVEITWAAFEVAPDCFDGPPDRLIDGVTNITSHSAVAEFRICPGGHVTTLTLNLLTGVGFGTSVLFFNYTVPAGFNYIPLQFLLADCCPSGLSPTTNYRLQVSGSNSEGFLSAFNMDFTTTSEPGTPPANDDIGDAETISGASGSVDGDNWNATQEAGENTALYGTDHTLYEEEPVGGKSVWYEWTAPATGDYAFWTETPDDTFNDSRGICDSILTVLSSTTFTDIVTQNEFSQGQPPGFFVDNDQYPLSLINFHATGGHTYLICVDSNQAFSDCCGPFRLRWGPAVCAFPAIRNTVLLSFDATTAVAQFEINPQGYDGHYWACASTSPPSTTVCSPHASAPSGFEWSTVTRTITGLQPNTPYGNPPPYFSTGANFTVVDNECYPGLDFGEILFFPGFYTPINPDVFGFCTPGPNITFLGDDCTAPTTSLPGSYTVTVTDGYKMQQGNLAAYVWQEANAASVTDGSGTGWATPGTHNNPASLDVWATLVEIAAKQDVGIFVAGSSTSGSYYARSDADAGEVQIIKYTFPPATETILASIPMILNNGDRLGLRYELITGDLSVWVSTGIGFTKVLTANDSSFGDETNAGIVSVLVEQSADGFDGTIDQSLAYPLSTFGQTPTGSQALFPPFSCCDHVDKYRWHCDGQASCVGTCGAVFGDAKGFLQWAGPYYGGGSTHDLPTVDCPVWWLQMQVWIAGRIDCTVAGGAAGDDGIFQSVLAANGAAGAQIPFYPDVTDYAAAIHAAEGFDGFFNWDSDSHTKASTGIQNNIAYIQSAYSSEGAYTYTNIADGGKHSYGVFMPVKVAPGRINDIGVSDERCGQGIGPVSFSHVRSGNKRGGLQIR